ncbi:hypothetical protein ASPCADRAFT_60039, partial [Aspergillus carbonarius ITEM 5010]
YLINSLELSILFTVDYIKDIKIYINLFYRNYKDSKLIKEYIIFYTESLIL